MHDTLYFNLRMSEGGLHVPEAVKSLKVLKDINVDRERNVRIYSSDQGRLLHEYNPMVGKTSNLFILPKGMEKVMEEYPGYSYVAMPFDLRDYKVAFTSSEAGRKDPLENWFEKSGSRIDYPEGFVQEYGHGLLLREHHASLDENSDIFRESDLFIISSEKMLDVLKSLYSGSYFHIL